MIQRMIKSCSNFYYDNRNDIPVYTSRSNDRIFFKLELREGGGEIGGSPYLSKLFSPNKWFRREYQLLGRMRVT